MNFLQIANSQFADTCKIPRPTISQILNGRNKKISDELISKIHDAYPQLSVLWLMFGEGEMLLDTNIKISDDKNQSTINFEQAQHSEEDVVMPQFDFGATLQENDSEKSTSTKKPENPHKIDFVEEKPTSQQSFNEKYNQSTSQQSISLNPNSNKKIQSIMVFYNDNSFEIFSPTEKSK